MRVVTAARELYFGVGACAAGARLHAEACTECTRAVGRGTHTALHLNVVDARCEVGRIYPEHVVALGIVKGNAVDGHVDACSVNPANAER